MGESVYEDINVNYTYVTRNSLGFLVCPSAMAVIGNKTNNMQDRKEDIFFSLSLQAHYQSSMHAQYLKIVSRSY